MSGYRVLPLPSAAEVRAGDDLARHALDALATAGERLVDGDVLCVASKVVAKSEGATAPLPPGDRDAARRALAAERAVRVVADTPWVLVVETHHGFVCANAGVDLSNVPDDDVALLLPDAPDASAAGLRAALRERTGADVGVLVTDSFGRPWRLGQVDVALGAAGLHVLRDERGATDRDGRTLEVTLVAVADQLAGAADLARAKADGTPFVLVRGLDVAGDGAAADLLRPSADDVFRAGGPTAVEQAVAAVTTPTGGDEPLGPVRRGLLGPLGRAANGALLPVRCEGERLPDDTLLLRLRDADPHGVGAALQAVATVAAAHGLVVRPRRADGGLDVLVGTPR